MTTSHPTAAEAKAYHTASPLLTAPQVAELLGVDRSTVYRMAADGRLPALKVGRQWRFPTDQITQLFEALLPGPGIPTSPDQHRRRLSPATVDTRIASAIIDLAAEALNVMMVVTDLDGRPLTDVANPLPATRGGETHATILATWQQMAHQSQMAAHFELGPLGLLCAKSPIRHGAQPIGFVFATGQPDDTPHGIEPRHQQLIIRMLPKIAQILATIATASVHA